MGKYIDKPNIPCGKVSLFLADMRTRKTIIDELKRSGADIILTGRCEGLYDAVCCHPDMYIHHLGGKNVVVAPNTPINTMEELRKRGFHIIRGEKIISGKYPDSVAYNVARIGEYAVCSTKYSDSVLLNHLYDMNIKLVDIKQGYSKCSICIVNIGAVITSDEGIYRALLMKGFDVLKINPGYIKLPGLNYGFIGGASGLLDNASLSFAGDVRNHPDYSSIEKFLYKYDICIKLLDNGELTDIGSIIPLMERSEI